MCGHPGTLLASVLAMQGDHLRAAAFKQLRGQASISPASRQQPAFAFPSGVSFNTQIYKVENWGSWSPDSG